MPTPEKAVTDRRRQLILQAVVYLSKSFEGTGDKGCDGKQVNDCLQQWIQTGFISWPEASWSHARNDLYYAGTYQHLRAMARVGIIEWLDRSGKFVPAASTTGDGFRRRAVDVLRLKSEGKKHGAIAEELGISTSLVGSLLNDPTGEKEKERKRGYCPSCGAKKKPEATVCIKCLDRKATELLPPSTFKSYIERARVYGYELVFGVTLDFRRVIRVDVGRGFFEHEVRSDLSWLDAVAEVGDEIGVDLG